jgi:acyl dehydratase
MSSRQQEPKKERSSMTTASAGKKLYVQDIAVGDEFRSFTHRLDSEQIIAFAKQFDPQPFHLDEQAAEASFFQGLAASGWHTMAITMRLLVDSLPFACGVIGAGAEISWPQPTRPGDILYVKSKVLEIKPSQSRPDRATLVMESLTFNQNDELRQKLVARLLAFRREE